MKQVVCTGIVGYGWIALVTGLMTAGHAKGDIVDGIRALGDSIAIWQTTPPVWDLTGPVGDGSEGFQDALDAGG